MLYPNNFNELIGFNKIKEEIKKLCLTEQAQELVDNLKYSDSIDIIQREINETNEVKNIIELGYNIPIHHFSSIEPVLNKSKITGGFAEVEELHGLKGFIDIYNKSWTFIRTFIDFEIPSLNNLIPTTEITPHLYSALDRTLDAGGEVKSNASPELMRIHQEKLAKESSLRSKINELHESYTAQGFIGDDMAPTIRNGRAVIPVKAEYKRVVNGMIHDESSTGQTTFIEPEQVVQINNDLTELYYKERREIMRILTELTDLVKQNALALYNASVFLENLDFIRAKAKFAIKIKANAPVLTKGSTIEIKDARHPLLALTMGGKVIANNFYFDDANRILLISGPNAGGKSVSLKTLGLVQYMLQCGLLVPVKETSEFMLFKDFFADIGDNQSLEDDLSTYSAHLSNMSHLLEKGTPKTLVLIDEFGTGTEPEYGGAIAETILEEILETKAYGLITTHYANLKAFAQNNNGIQNGAMGYDIGNLKPLYQLSIGEPGRSYALEIAQSKGFRNDILERAKSKIGGSHVSFDTLVKEVEQERLKLKKLTSSLESKEATLSTSINELKDERKKLKQDRKEIIENAKEAGRNIIQGSNKLIEKAVRDIKEKKASSDAIKKAKGKIEHQSKLLKSKSKGPKVVDTNFQVGDFVRIKGQSSTAEITALDDKSAEITSGILKMKVQLSRLEKVGKKVKTTSSGSNVAQQLINKRSHFSSKIDVRGDRTEEALSKVTAFVDEALILGEKELQILHGKGNGILKEMIRQHLKGMRGIEKMEDAHIDHGGSGITIIHLS